MMRHYNIKAFLWIVVPLSILIWVLLIFLAELGANPIWSAIKRIPTVIMIDFGLWLFFVKWAWKWRVFQGWLVPFPILEGTWSGVMKSTWTDPATKTTIPPIQFTLVIRQSFLSISCSIYTVESSSISYSSDIVIDKETKRTQLLYHYSNRPQAIVRNRSEIHDGTVLLTIMGNKPIQMKGEYWTSRKTIGDIEVKFLSRELRDGFLKDERE
jgi:hypothetical protein